MIILFYGNYTFPFEKNIFEWNDINFNSVKTNAQTISQLQKELFYLLSDYSIDFKLDKIQHGNLIGVSFEDCLIISNKNQPNNFFKLVLTIHPDVDNYVINIFRTGEYNIDSSEKCNNYIKIINKIKDFYNSKGENQ